MVKRKKVGLALSGGGARGFAHIGVIKTLEKNNIPIDIVSGTSIGAVIGALYCSGYSGNEIEEIAKETDWKKLIDLTIPKKGLLKGDKIENYLRKLIGNKKFSDLQKPLLISSVDLNKPQEIIFNKGDIVKAIRASISIPGVFLPVESGNRVLVDGGVLNNLPVQELKENGAEIIIAVNLNKKEVSKKVYGKIPRKKRKKATKKFHIGSLITDSYNILETEKTKLLLNDFPSDVMINPDLTDIRMHEFQKINPAINKGMNSCEEKMGEIKSLIEEKKGIGKETKKFVKRAKDVVKDKYLP